MTINLSLSDTEALVILASLKTTQDIRDIPADDARIASKVASEICKKIFSAREKANENDNRMA